VGRVGLRYEHRTSVPTTWEVTLPCGFTFSVVKPRTENSVSPVHFLNQISASASFKSWISLLSKSG